MIKRFRVFALLLVAFALVAAACGSDDSTDTTSGGGDAGGDGPSFGALGGVVVEPGADIQIRSLNAISGDVAFLGIPNQRAIELAIEDFGAIADHTVTIGTPLDDLCSNEGGQAAGQAIVAQEDVVGVIGTSCSGAAVAASPLITGAGMVLISPSNTSPALTSDLEGTAGTDYHVGYYRTAHNDLFQGAAVAEFVYNELGLRTAGAIHDGDPYTQGLAAAFQNSFEELGGTVSVFTAVNKGDTDMVPVLTEVAAGAPEVIYYPIFMPEGGFIAQQIGGVSGLENVVQIGADGLLVDNFLELPESEGLYFSGPDLQFGDNASTTGENANGFLATYDARFGEAPSAPFWAHSYDATVMLLDAIQKVALTSDDGSLFIDRQLVRDELDKISNLAGMTGSLTCDGFGDCGSQRITIVLHTDSGDVDAGKANVVFSFAPST